MVMRLIDGAPIYQARYQNKMLTTSLELKYKAQPGFTCSKSTMGTPEQCVESVQNYQ